MRYSVNYTGMLFTDDKEGVNTFYTDRFEEAMSLLRDIINHAIDIMAYLKDEEYQCSMYWDEKEKEFYWEVKEERTMKIWCVDHAGLTFNVYSELFFTKEEAQDRYDSLYAGPGSYRKMYQVEDIWGWCGRNFVKVIHEVLTSRDDGGGATFIYGMCNEIREAASCCGLKQYSVDGFWISKDQFILSLAWLSGDKLEHYTFSLTGRDDTYISSTIVERRSKWQKEN